MYVDDLYICNGAGSINNDFLGDVAVEGLVPNGNGATSQWVGSDGNSTDNYLLVDELPANGIDFVESNVVGNVDLYTLTDLVRTSGTVYGVQLHPGGQKSDSGARGVKPVIRRGGTNYEGAEWTLAGGYTVNTELWETDPSTGALWTIAGVNAMEAGVKVST